MVCYLTEEMIHAFKQLSCCQSYLMLAICITSWHNSSQVRHALFMNSETGGESSRV